MLSPKTVWGMILHGRRSHSMRKIALALVFVVVFCTVALARIHVNPTDIQTYKSNFDDAITQDVNETGESDSVVYAFIIEAINNAWDTYTEFPLYVYSESGGETSYTTIKEGDDRFELDVVKLIEVQSKARFLRAIYTSMQEIDISNVLEPEWFMIAIQDSADEVVYLLEVNPGQSNYRKLEEELISLLKETTNMDSTFNTVLKHADYQITIATYVKKYDELVINLLFADGDGNVYGEAVLTRDHIFGKFLAMN